MSERESKKSFVLYHDLVNVVEKLTKKDREDNTNNAGELFLLILEYVNGENDTPPNFIVEMAFEPIRQQLNRDFDKWETERLKRIEAGRKGGEKSGEVRRAKANEASASNDEANEASASNGTNEADANKADTTRKASTGLNYIDENDLPF